jgi:hypothetical protein
MKYGTYHSLDCWLLFLLLLIFVQQAEAQSSAVFSLVSSSQKHVVVRFTGEQFYFQSRRTSRGMAQILITKKGIQSLVKEAPMLPGYATSLLLPNEEKMVVKVISAHYYEEKNLLVAPSKGNLFRSHQQDSLPFIFGKVYEKNTFYPGRLWETSPVYTLHQKSGQTLRLFPFWYNPVKRILRVYDKIVLDITFRTDNKKFAVQRELSSSAVFAHVYNQQFLNYPSGFKSVQKQSPAPKMLIISYGPFIPLLKDFIQWKRQTGIHVAVADVASIGKNAKDIKAYIGQVYRQWGISYVLLVGNAAQVPSSSIAGNDSDNDYAYVDGDDHYPDLFVGRFSAENATELTTMVNRTLIYEKGLSPTDSCYSRAIGIGSEMGVGYHDLTDYQQIMFIDSAYLLASTYVKATELFDGSQGGRDANGDPTSEMLTKAVEKGAGIINYCGHGSTNGWNTTHFDNDKVDDLKNIGQWPFIISVSCATGDFVHQDCFAEHWLRAVHNGKPAGAVALFMPTITQSWDPPMCGQQEINALLAAPDSVHPPRTFATICMTGCMKMNDEYGTAGYEITDTWTVFGDPSLEVRTAVPQKIIADYPSSVDDTCSSVLVKTNLRSGRVALFSKGIIYAVAEVNSLGNALLSVDSVPSGSEADLTITAFNHLPFSGKVTWEKAANVLADKESLPGLKVFPNPAKESVTISFVLNKNRQIGISVFNLDGQKIKTFFKGTLSSGRHHFLWHPANRGVYFVQLKAGEMSVVKKIIIRK